MPEAFFETLIVGGGAAGLSAASLYVASGRSQSTLLLEGHDTLGGSAGYFARGFPKRVHDAGATQLIECGPGALQREILRLAAGDGADELLNRAQSISSLHHLWRDKPRQALVLDQQGSARLSGETDLAPMWKAMESFLDRCARDASWLWKLFYTFPDFPPQNMGDLLQILSRALVLGPGDILRSVHCLGLSVADVAREHGIVPGTRVWQVMSALLLDTSQNTPEKTPYLVGALGLSIVKRGIVRLPRGMMDLFVTWERGLRSQGLSIQKSHRVVEVRSEGAKGFLVTVRGGSHAGPSERLLVFRTRHLLWAAPLAALLRLVPKDDPLRGESLWHRWQASLRHSYEWQACALHGVATGPAPVDDEKPWYVQVFPKAGDPTCHAIYVSLAPLTLSTREGVAPQEWRSFTASLHVDDAQEDFFRPSNRAAVQEWMVRTLEEATGLKLDHTELALPRTYERYTFRPEGRVGGFVASFDNFLFRAIPKHLILPGDTQLCLAGDSVFPGQGVVTTSLSGVLAWSRLTGEKAAQYLKTPQT